MSPNDPLFSVADPVTAHPDPGSAALPDQGVTPEAEDPNMTGAVGADTAADPELPAGA
jgi:hypothetical protein